MPLMSLFKKHHDNEPPPLGEDEVYHLHNKIVDALKTIYDPEIPVNIYDLGLIYEILIQDDGRVDIKMTLTAPACPVAGILPGQVEKTVAGVAGVTKSHVELVWDPPWNKERMTEEAMLELGLL